MQCCTKRCTIPKRVFIEGIGNVVRRLNVDFLKKNNLHAMVRSSHPRHGCVPSKDLRETLLPGRLG